MLESILSQMICVYIINLLKFSQQLCQSLYLLESYQQICWSLYFYKVSIAMLQFILSQIIYLYIFTLLKSQIYLCQSLYLVKITQTAQNRGQNCWYWRGVLYSYIMSNLSDAGARWIFNLTPPSPLNWPRKFYFEGSDYGVKKV